MNTIHIITICKNEIDIIQKFIDHHQNITDKFTIIDNGSTDGTLDAIASNKNIELIIDKSRFEFKVPIIKKNIEYSKQDIIIPLDTDELLVHDHKKNISKNFNIIKKYLQNLKLNYSTYKIKNIYNYIPNSDTKYSIEKNYWRSRKFILNRNDFIDTCPGFHQITSKTKNSFQTDISYIHMHYRSFDAWYKSAKQKMMARVGENWNNIEVLKNYTGHSNHTAKALYRYFTTGEWLDELQEDIEINI